MINSPYDPNSSISSDFSWWIRKCVKNIEDYFEENTAVHITIKTLAIVVSFIGFIASSNSLISNVNPPVFFILPAIFFAVLDTFHVLLAKRRQNEILVRDDEIKVRNKIISSITSHLHHYDVNSSLVKRTLHVNGDVEVHREIEIVAIAPAVVAIRFEVHLPSPKINEVVNPKSLEFTACKIAGGENIDLRDILLSDESNNKVFLVILDPPLLQGETLKVKANYRLEGAWKDLFVRGEDNGYIHILHRTKQCKFEFVLPQEWYFLRPSLTPGIADQWRNTFNAKNRSNSLKLEILNPKVGQRYDFTIKVKRTNI